MNQQNFYVYVYLDPRKSGQFVYEEHQFDYEPFYVGKGFGYRKFRHMSDYVLKTDNNKMKVNKINKILNENIQPIVIEYRNNLCEVDAFNLEKELITKIGRRDLSSGPLCNLTDGGEGNSGHIMSLERREKIRNSKLGMKLSDEIKKRLSVAQTKRWNIMSKEDRESIAQKLKCVWDNEKIEAHRINMSGENNPCFGRDFSGINNPNYGNKWSDEQKRKLSDYQKINSNFTKNNPQKINPNRGDSCGTNKFIYYVYNLDGELIFKNNSLSNIAEKFGLYMPCIKKFAPTSHFYNGYYFRRRCEDDPEIVISNQVLIEMKSYDIRFKIGKKLNCDKTLLNYYKYIVYKDNCVVLETYHIKDVTVKFGAEMAKSFRKDKFNAGAKYKEFFIKREELTEEFLNEIN